VSEVEVVLHVSSGVNPGGVGQCNVTVSFLSMKYVVPS